MSKNKEKATNYMLLNMSTSATYDSNQAYQKTVMPRIPTKVQMKQAQNVKTASSENLFGRKAEIESVKKPEKKKPNLPLFAKMTGRSSRYFNYNNTDESPENVQQDNK